MLEQADGSEKRELQAGAGPARGERAAGGLVVTHDMDRGREWETGSVGGLDGDDGRSCGGGQLPHVVRGGVDVCAGDEGARRGVVADVAARRPQHVVGKEDADAGWARVTPDNQRLGVGQRPLVKVVRAVGVHQLQRRVAPDDAVRRQADTGPVPPAGTRRHLPRQQSGERAQQGQHVGVPAKTTDGTGDVAPGRSGAVTVQQPSQLDDAARTLVVGDGDGGGDGVVPYAEDVLNGLRFAVAAQPLALRGREPCVPHAAENGAGGRVDVVVVVHYDEVVAERRAEDAERGEPVGDEVGEQGERVAGEPEAEHNTEVEAVHAGKPLQGAPAEAQRQRQPAECGPDVRFCNDDAAVGAEPAQERDASLDVGVSGEAVRAPARVAESRVVERDAVGRLGAGVDDGTRRRRAVSVRRALLVDGAQRDQLVQHPGLSLNHQHVALLHLSLQPLDDGRRSVQRRLARRHRSAAGTWVVGRHCRAVARHAVETACMRVQGVRGVEVPVGPCAGAAADDDPRAEPRRGESGEASRRRVVRGPGPRGLDPRHVRGRRRHVVVPAAAGKQRRNAATGVPDRRGQRRVPPSTSYGHGQDVAGVDRALVVARRRVVHVVVPSQPGEGGLHHEAPAPLGHDGGDAPSKGKVDVLRVCGRAGHAAVGRPRHRGRRRPVGARARGGDGGAGKRSAGEAGWWHPRWRRTARRERRRQATVAAGQDARVRADGLADRRAAAVGARGNSAREGRRERPPSERRTGKCDRTGGAKRGLGRLDGPNARPERRRLLLCGR